MQLQCLVQAEILFCQVQSLDSLLLIRVSILINTLNKLLLAQISVMCVRFEVVTVLHILHHLTQQRAALQHYTRPVYVRKLCILLLDVVLVVQDVVPQKPWCVL